MDKEIEHLRYVWKTLRRYPQGCTIEDDYIIIRGIVKGIER